MLAIIGPNNISEIRLLDSPSNGVCSVTYFQLFHGQIAHTILDVRAFIHDHSLGIWVKVPSLA